MFQFGFICSVKCKKKFFNLFGILHESWRIWYEDEEVMKGRRWKKEEIFLSVGDSL